MRIWVFLLTFVLSTSALAFDLNDYSKGLDPDVHARFEAAFIFEQIRKQQAHFEEAVEIADVDVRRERIMEVAHYAGWMSFRFGQAVVAHPSSEWSKFDPYKSCMLAARDLQQLIYGINRVMVGTGKTTQSELDELSTSYGRNLAECGSVFGVVVD